CAQYSLLQIFSFAEPVFGVAPPPGCANTSRAMPGSASPPATAGAAAKMKFRREGRVLVIVIYLPPRILDPIVEATIHFLQSSLQYHGDGRQGLVYSGLRCQFA